MAIVSRLARYGKRELKPITLHRAEFVGLIEQACLELGCALLWIKSETVCGGVSEDYFFVKALRDERERLLGYRLRKLGSAETVYDLDCSFGGLEFASCDCPSGTFTPERPKGCRHRAALMDALKKAGL